jgi:hypothetical protein
MENATGLRAGGGGAARGRAWALGCFLAGSSLAAPVGAESNATIKYDGVVGAAHGPFADAFPAGTALRISYILDRRAVDTDPDPHRGYFPSALVSLSVSLPELGISVLAGPNGTASIYDNVEDTVSGEFSDQVFFRGGEIVSAAWPGGEEVSALEADFLSEFLPSPDQPRMIESDQLALPKLPFRDASVRLETTSGPTWLTFLPPPPKSAVAIKYDAVVIDARGPLAEAFPSGERLELSYEIDRHVPDQDSRPWSGFFPRAVRSMSMSLPDAGVFVTAPRGNAQSYDNVVEEMSGAVSDQVFIFASSVSSSGLASSEPIRFFEVEFIRGAAAPTDEPMLIDSDAVAAFKLPLDDANIVLRREDDDTFVRVAELSSGANEDGCTLGRRSQPRTGAMWLLALPGLWLWRLHRRHEDLG